MPQQQQTTTGNTAAAERPYRKCRSVAAAMSSARVASAAAAPVVKTIYQSSAIPTISFADYAVHIAARCSHGEDAVLLGLALLARYCKTTGVLPTPFTEHRLLLAAVVVASKTHYDDFYKNVYMARIGGVTCPELMNLELDFTLKLRGSTVIGLQYLNDFCDVMSAQGDIILTASSTAEVRSRAGRVSGYIIADKVTAAAPYALLEVHSSTPAAQYQELPVFNAVPTPTPVLRYVNGQTPTKQVASKSATTMPEKLRLTVSDAQMNASVPCLPKCGASLSLAPDSSRLPARAASSSEAPTPATSFAKSVVE